MSGFKKGLGASFKGRRVVKVYPYGSEEQLRWELALEYIFEADQRRLERSLQEKAQ